MDNSQKNPQEDLQIQKEILAYLNAKQDNRATSQEIIAHVKCTSELLCKNIAFLNEQKFIEGPAFTEELVTSGGENNFRSSTRITEAGQERFIEIIRKEQER